MSFSRLSKRFFVGPFLRTCLLSFFYERWSKQDPKPPFIPFGKTPPPTQVRDTLSSAKSLVRRMTIFFVHLVERGKEGGPGKKRGYGIRLMTWTLGQWGKRQRGRRNLVFSHLRAGGGHHNPSKRVRTRWEEEKGGGRSFPTCSTSSHEN